MIVPALRPATPRMPMPLMGHEQRSLSDTEPQQGCTPFWGPELLCCFNPHRDREKKAKADIQCQHKGLTATLNKITYCLHHFLSLLVSPAPIVNTVFQKHVF